MAHVFVSYSRQDKLIVFSLVYGLRQRGIPFWIDQEDIRGGTYWDNAIEQAIHKASCILLAISPGAVESENVKDEYSKAQELKKPIIPIRIGSVAELPMRFSRLQYIDMLENYNEAMDRLAEQLASHIPPDISTQDIKAFEYVPRGIRITEPASGARPNKIFLPNDREKLLQHPVPRLELVLDTGDGMVRRSWMMQSQSVMIGRKWHNDVVLHDGHISGSHARIYWEAGVYWVEDLGSRNGTFVNDEQLNGTPRTLTDDDRIRLASVVEIEFHLTRKDRTLPVRP